MGTLNWQDQKWLGTVWSHSSTTQMLFFKCLKGKPHRHYWVWLSLSVDFLLLFPLFFLAAQFKVKINNKKKNQFKRKKGWGGMGVGAEWEGWVRHYRKPIRKTTPLFFSDKTSVAKGRGDLHGNASKEKGTGRKWKDSTPPSLPKRCIYFHKKDGVQFLSGEISQTIWNKGD